MAIRIVRNENGNCINFVGSSNPVYFNACLSGEVDANDDTLVNVVNDIHTASSGQTEYEFYNIPYTEWEDRDGNAFANAAAVAAYITQEGNVATGTDVAAGYEGVWDASTNTPDLTTLTPANGDWFYVSVAGTYDSVEYKVNDIIKYSDSTSAWNLIPNETVRVDELDTTVAAIIFSTESALFNTNSEVYSDGDRGQVDPAGQEAGWYYTNTSSGLGHIEWHYVDNINPENVMTLETLKGMYALVKMESVTGLPQFEVYTQPTGDAADATATYRSLKVYNANVSAVSSYEGEEVLLYWGQDPTDKFPTAPHIELTLDSTVSAGPAGTDEDILFGAFATVNSAASGTYEFIAKKLGYINNTHAREYLLDVNDPVAAAASTDVQSSTVINFTKDASNTSIVLSHDGSHYGVNTISAVLESDGTVSIKGVGENGEDTVTNINYQNVQIAGVSPANTPAGVVNALNALFTVNPLGAGYVPVTVLPVSDGANVGLNLSEGIVPTEGIYAADSISTTSHGARVWTNETINQHGEFFEFKVTGDGDFVIGLGDDSDDRTEMADDSDRGVSAGFWWALRLTHTSAAAPFVQEHATTALYADASSNFVWQSGSGLGSNATTSSISTNGEMRDNVLNAEPNLYRVGINDNGFVYVSYYDAGRTNNFIEIVRSQTLVPSANYYAAVKLLEGDVKITHTPTVATQAVDAVTGDIDLSDATDGGSTFGTAEVSIGDTIIVIDRLEDGINQNDGFVSEVEISQPGEFFEVTVNLDQNHYIGISYDDDYSKSTIISEMDGATSAVGGSKYYFMGGYMNNVSDRITQQVRDPDGSSSGFTHLDGGGVDQENNTHFRVGFDLTGRATIWQTDDGTNYVVVKYVNTAAPTGTYRFLWKGVSHGAELQTLKKGQLTALTSVQWRYIESPDGDFYYPLFATTAEAIYADEQAGGSGTYHSHVFVDEPTSATWYMPDTGGVHAGSSAPTDSKYTEIPTEDDANYAPAAFSQADVSFNENVAVNQQIEAVGTTAYTTTVTGLPTWLTFNGNLIQGTTPYVSSDTTITITVTRANSYGSSTGTFDLTVTDNASLGNLTGWTELDGNFYQPNILINSEDGLLQFDTTLGQGQQLTYTYPTGSTNKPPTIGILNSTGQSRWDSYDAATDTLGSGNYNFAETDKWALRYTTFGGYIGGSQTRWNLVGWSDNTIITGAEGDNYDVEFKLEYANDGYIRLYRGGTLQKTSASTFSGDQTITAAVFTEANDNRIPTNWTISSIGAGSTTPPSGFVDPLLEGEMDSATMLGDFNGNQDAAVQLTDTLEAGKRYVFPQTWLEANVLPNGALGTVSSTAITGVTQEGPSSNQTGTNFFNQGQHGWISVNEGVGAGQRISFSTDWLVDFMANSTINQEFRMGFKDPNWTNANGTGASYFEDNCHLFIQYTQSTIYARLYGGNYVQTVTFTLAGLAASDTRFFFEITSDGNNIRAGISQLSTGDDLVSTSYADWSNYKVTTEDYNRTFGITERDFVIKGSPVFTNTPAFDLAGIDFTAIEISDIPETSTYIGVPDSSASWTDVDAVDFDAHFEINRSSSTTAHRSKIKTESTSLDSIQVNSITDAFYDYALEWDGQDLHVIACNIGDINTEPGVSNGGSFSRTVTESNYSATGDLDIVIGVDGGAQVELTTTGLQKIDIPAGPNDILVSEVSEGSARFDVGNGPVESNEITLTAGQTYRFMLSNASIESGDTLTFEQTSDGSTYTTGVTTVGNHGDYLYYVQFAVPADAPPLRAVWNGTDNPPFNIAGSTYVVDTSDADIAGPSGNFSGDLLTGTHAWVELDLRLDPGERVIIPAAFHEDMAAAIGMELNASGGYAIGIASPAHYSNQRDNSGNSKRVNFFDEHRIGHYRNASGQYQSELADGTTADAVLTHSGTTYNTQNEFIELDSSGNQLRQGFDAVGGDDPATVTYANWTGSRKHQTAVLSSTYSNLQIIVYVSANDDGDNVDLSSVDFSLITKQNIPTASSITTSWTKAIDFAGGNERMEQVTSDGNRVPMMMGGLATTVAAPTTTGYTSNDSNARPWATSVVFKAHIYNSNQHIWNVGEGGGTTDDNIYLRRDSNRYIWLGWGRSGTTELNECYITDIGTAIGSWWGIYVAYNGTRLSATNATAANLAACFDIRVVNLETGAAGSNLSTSANWTSGSTGGRMDYSFTSTGKLMSIGGRGTNRNFRGKIASVVSTTLRRNVAMPTDAEIGMIVRDPVRWLSDYKVGNAFRLPWQSSDAGFNFAMNDGSSSYATQVWLMGDGPSDAYSQIRNHVWPATTSYTPQNMLGMVSSDIETVTITGLT